MKHLLTLEDLNTEEVLDLIKVAKDLKTNPQKYSKKLLGKTLLMFFEKPSLRTRLSFDIGIKQLGGFGIVVDVGSTPLGKKESIEDTAKVCSRYAQGIMARLFSHDMLLQLAKHSSIPIINGLTDDYHPVQILSDLLTISEKKKTLKGLTLCFLGDGHNNVTHSLLLGCSLMGIHIQVGCPKEAMPKKEIVEKAQKNAAKHNSSVLITQDTSEAVKGADIIYADSWMSYQVKESEQEKRVKMFTPYQVNEKTIKGAQSDFIFMNCLPAQRGFEQTAQIIDGKHSVVFDQAENRLHMQKALMLLLMGEK